MEEQELERMIPSKTVRDYVMETGWTFTDFQKASLLCHRGLLLKEEYSYLNAFHRYPSGVSKGIYCGKGYLSTLFEALEKYRRFKGK